MRRVLSILAAVLASVAVVAPVGAITHGAPDNGEHPYVGELLFYVPDAADPRFDDPGGWFNCTGTLMNSRIVLTAGHCTFAIGLNGASTRKPPLQIASTVGSSLTTTSAPPFARTMRSIPARSGVPGATFVSASRISSLTPWRTGMWGVYGRTSPGGP